jgi:iron-sulfur cluster assembly accessory protein
MIILTREAVTAVHGAIDRAGKPGFGLRLSAESNGCARPRYAMSLEDEPQADDVVVEIRDLRVFVDPDSMTLLAGTTVGFSSSLEGAGFTFDNPNAGTPELENFGAEHHCSCGKSCG